MSNEPLYQFPLDTIATVGIDGSGANYASLLEAFTEGKRCISLVSNVDEKSNILELSVNERIVINLNGYELTYSNGGVILGLDSRIDYNGPGMLLLASDNDADPTWNGLTYFTDSDENGNPINIDYEETQAAEHHHIYINKVVILVFGGVNLFSNVTINSVSTQYLLFNQNGTFANYIGRATCFSSCVFLGFAGNSAMLKFDNIPANGGTITNCVLGGAWRENALDEETGDAGVIFGNMTVLNLNVVSYTNYYIYATYLDGLTLEKPAYINVAAWDTPNSRSIYFANINLRVETGYGVSYGCILAPNTFNAVITNCKCRGFDITNSYKAQVSNCVLDMYNGDESIAIVGENLQFSNCIFTNSDESNWNIEFQYYGTYLLIVGAYASFVNCDMSQIHDTVLVEDVTYANISNCTFVDFYTVNNSNYSKICNCNMSNIFCNTSHTTFSNCYVDVSVVFSSNECYFSGLYNSVVMNSTQNIEGASSNSVMGCRIMSSGNANDFSVFLGNLLD